MKALRVAVLAAALTIPSFSFAQSQETATLIPEQANAAGFVNVSKILADYGSIFDGGPFAEQLDQYVAMGLPDPREEDLKQVAFASTIEGFDFDSFAVYVSRGEGQAPDLTGRVAAFLAAAGLGEVSQEAYHGVTLHGVKLPSEEANPDTIQVKMGELSETQSLVSFDEAGVHPFGKLSIDTAAGQNPSFYEKHGTQLKASSYAHISFEMPADLKADLEGTEFAFLAAIDQAALSLGTAGEEIRLALAGTCADEETAETLKVALVDFFAALRKQYPDLDDQFGEILDSVEFGRTGKVTTVSLALPKDFVDDLIGAVVGGGAVE